jgi:oligoendopeptidase F
MKRAARMLAGVLGTGAVVVWAATAWGQTLKIPQRHEIEAKYKWNLGDIYSSKEAWESDLARVQSELPSLKAKQGTLGTSAEHLYTALQLRDSLWNIVDRLYVYAFMKLDEDSRISDQKVLADKASLVYTDMSSAASFIEPEIVAIPDGTLKGYLDGYAPLALYRQHLDNMVRMKAHTLSSDQEQLLAEASQVTRSPGDIFNMLETADLKYGTVVDEKGDTVQLTKERYSKFLESTDRRLRREANFAYNDAYEKLQNTFNASYSGSVRADIFYANARKYPSVLAMRLDANNIPEAVYENLINTVRNNLEPYHACQALRKRVLGVDTLHGYDTYVPLVPEAKLEFTYEQAKEAVRKGLTRLGKQYSKDLGIALDAGWVDVYETEGKASGAYNWGAYSTHPYVLMNFNGTLESMFTLGHEMGHAMHGFYAHANQPYVYGDNPTFTAEVASTTNEALIMNQLLKDTKDPEQRKYLLNYYIQQIQGTFYTQAMFSEFEHTVHQKMEAGEPVSAAGMREIYRDIYQRYLGTDVFVDPNNDMTWARISHFYRSYYVYQYATSYTAGIYIARQIVGGNDKLRDKYIEFLKKGSSSYPVDQLKEMGVDLTQPEPVQAVTDLFRDLVKQLSDLMVKS